MEESESVGDSVRVKTENITEDYDPSKSGLLDPLLANLICPTGTANITPANLYSVLFANNRQLPSGRSVSSGQPKGNKAAESPTLANSNMFFGDDYSALKDDGAEYMVGPL